MTDVAKRGDRSPVPAGWTYAPAPEIAFNWIELKLPGAPAFGLKLDSAPLYVAASKNTPGIDFAKWQAAYVGMEKDGTRGRILAAYGL